LPGSWPGASLGIREGLMEGSGTMFGKKAKDAKAVAPEDDPKGGAPAAEGEGGEAPAKKKLAGRTLVLFIILPSLLVLGGGAGGAIMLLSGEKDPAELAENEHGELKPPGGKKPKAKDDGHGAAAGEHGEAGAIPEGAMDPANVGWLVAGADGDPSYYNMPKVIVNLSTSEEERPLLLELQLVLEAGDAHTFDEVPVMMPRLKDQLQTFLRELRVEDLSGSAGSYRLRLELLKRFNLVLAPAKVDAVLIEGILIQ
jgi:flagellar FliL protein